MFLSHMLLPLHCDGLKNTGEVVLETDQNHSRNNNMTAAPPILDESSSFQFVIVLFHFVPIVFESQMWNVTSSIDYSMYIYSIVHIFLSCVNSLFQLQLPANIQLLLTHHGQENHTLMTVLYINKFLFSHATSPSLTNAFARHSPW